MRTFLTLILVFIMAVVVVQAQDIAPSQQQGAPVSNSLLPMTYLEKDARLTRPMTVQSRSLFYPNLCLRITRATRARIYTGLGTDTIPVAIAADNVSARAIMDALAALHLTRWERTEDNGYRLLTSQRNLDFVYGDRGNEHRRERFQAGTEFVQGLNGISPADRQRILSGRFLSFASLPAQLQPYVPRMLESLGKEHPWSVFPGSRLSEAEFRMERRPKDEFDEYSVTVRIPGEHSTGWKINTYEQRKLEREAQRRQWARSGQLDPLHAPVHFEVTPEQARRMPALQKLVELSARKVTLPEALMLLHKKYGIAFISNAPLLPVEKPRRTDIHLSTMPLHEALDKMTTEIYPDCEWEWRKYGVLVVRDAANSVRRNAAQGQNQTQQTVTMPQQSPLPGAAASPKSLLPLRNP